MKNPSCFWHHLIFNPHPPFSRPAAGSGFFDSKTSKLLRCWTRYYAGARSQYLARARGAHRAGRSGRGGQGGGLLLAAVQGIGAGDQARRRGAVCRCSLFSAAAGSSSVGDAGGDLLHSSTFHGMPPGCFSRGSGAVLFAVPEGGYTLHLTGLRSRCRALT